MPLTRQRQPQKGDLEAAEASFTTKRLATLGGSETGQKAIAKSRDPTKMREHTRITESEVRTQGTPKSDVS